MNLSFHIHVENCLKFPLKKKSGQNINFNPLKCAPKVKLANIMACANITAHSNTTVPMVKKYENFNWALVFRVDFDSNPNPNPTAF